MLKNGGRAKSQLFRCSKCRNLLSELAEYSVYPFGGCGIVLRGASWDEENWKAQYGQVNRSSEEPISQVPVTDLWDWALVKGSKKDGKGEDMRLVGRLMRKSTKLHPSMPSGGCLLRTAPICEVHHDLVRVKRGQIYKLQSPSARFLATLLVYDSSNPTKDWGFPELSLGRQLLPISKSNRKSESETVDEVSVGNDLPLRDQESASDKSREYAYRDRAAERRDWFWGGSRSEKFYSWLR